MVRMLPLVYLLFSLAGIYKLLERLHNRVLSAGLITHAVMAESPALGRRGRGKESTGGGSASGGLAKACFAAEVCRQNAKQVGMENGAPSGEASSARHRKKREGSREGIKPGCKTRNWSVSENGRAG